MSYARRTLTYRRVPVKVTAFTSCYLSRSILIPDLASSGVSTSQPRKSLSHRDPCCHTFASCRSSPRTLAQSQPSTFLIVIPTRSWEILSLEGRPKTSPAASLSMLRMAKTPMTLETCYHQIFIRLFIEWRLWSGSTGQSSSHWIHTTNCSMEVPQSEADEETRISTAV